MSLVLQTRLSSSLLPSVIILILFSLSIVSCIKIRHSVDQNPDQELQQARQTLERAREQEVHKQQEAQEQLFKATQATETTRCDIQMFAAGGERMCVPKSCSKLDENLQSPVWQQLQHWFMECESDEVPCLPAEVQLPTLPFAANKTLNKCPMNCAENGQIQYSFCIPPDMRGLNITGFKHVPTCPPCVRMCLPSWYLEHEPFQLPNNSSSSNNGLKLNIPTCPTTFSHPCNDKNIKYAVCAPHELRHLRARFHLNDTIDICSSCTLPCYSPYLKLGFPEAAKHAFPHCRTRPKSCNALGTTSRKACLPIELYTLNINQTTTFDSIKHLRTCKKCEKPCIPQTIWPTLSNPVKQILKIPKCQNKPDLCPRHSYRFCTPKHYRFPFQHLLKQSPPICGQCTKPCIPTWLNLPAGLSALVEHMPRCKLSAKCQRRSKGPAICIPPELHDFNVTGIGRLPTCYSCVEPCLPSSIPSHSLPDIFRPQKCHIQPSSSSSSSSSSSCNDMKPSRFCLPRFLRYLKFNMPALKALALEPCPACTDMCVPSYVKLPASVRGLLPSVPTCQNNGCTNKKPPTFCMPKALSKLAVFDEEISSKLSQCEDCTDPCIPTHTSRYLKLSSVRFPLCPAPKCAGRTKQYLCIPSALRQVIPSIPALAQLAIPNCQECEDMCMPESIILPQDQLPAGFKLAPKCKPICHQNNGTKAICLPEELVHLKLSSIQHLPLCPKCTKPCQPKTQHTWQLSLPSAIHFEPCEAMSSMHMTNNCTIVNQALCLPLSLKNLQQQQNSYLDVCPECTSPCLPKHVNIQLPFNMKLKPCPETVCATVELKPCLSEEYKMLKIDGWKNWKKCSTCERTCIPSQENIQQQQQLQLPSFISLPACPAATTV